MYDSIRTVDQTFYNNNNVNFAVSTGNSQTQMITKRITRGYKNRRVQFVGGTVTAPSNGVYIIFVSDSGVVTHPQAEYFVKLNFADN